MQHLTTTDLDHVSGGSATTAAPSPSTQVTALAVPPGVDTTLQVVPLFRGGPVHRPHVD